MVPPPACVEEKLADGEFPGGSSFPAYDRGSSLVFAFSPQPSAHRSDEHLLGTPPDDWSSCEPHQEIGCKEPSVHTDGQHHSFSLRRAQAEVRCQYKQIPRC